jgi:hypothetical protein
MKSITRISLLFLVLALMVPFGTIGAQDGGNDASFVQISAVYFHSAASGTLTANDDGSYTLTLSGVGSDILFLVSVPVLEVRTLDMEPFMANWAASEGLAADAVLEVAGLNVNLTLSAPVHNADDESVQYTATVNSVVALTEEKDEPTAPEAFDAANLSIGWTMDFQNGLFAGLQLRYEDIRATPEECAAAQTKYDAYLAWEAQAKIAYQTAYTQCRDTTLDATTRNAACATEKTLAVQRLMAAQAILPTITLLNNECP